MPIEAAVTRFTARRRRKARHQQMRRERAERHGIAQAPLRRGPAGLEPCARRASAALDMRLPERLRDRVVTCWRPIKSPDRGGGGDASSAAAASSGADRSATLGRRQPEQRMAAISGNDAEKGEARWAGRSAQHQPEPARRRQEDGQRRGEGGERGHSRSPQQVCRAPLERRAQAERVAIPGHEGGCRCLQKAAPSPGPWPEIS